jgi:ring-1,2-phenylacetyl-CoA epoxidase subunit PaaB
VTDITVLARAAEAAGADALSLINTLAGMLIDIEARRPLLGNTFGGLSGRAIMPVALKMVWQAAEAVKIPLIGMGGIKCLNANREVFTQGEKGVPHEHAGSVHAADAEQALQNARDVYTRRGEAVSLWVVPSSAIVASAPSDEGPFFDPGNDKPYRHPQFYVAPRGVRIF